MPFKDKEAKLAYQRRWYAAHSDRVIAKVAKRKHTAYAMPCANCGVNTMGDSKPRPGQVRYCQKPECKRAQNLAQRDVFAEAGRKGRAKQLARNDNDVYGVPV